MKNSIKDKTYSFKIMRERELDFIKNTPFYGTDDAKKLYDSIKRKYDILQVGVCGEIVSIVSYKKDADNMMFFLTNMFKNRIVKQKTCHLTELITTYTIPKN